VEVREKRARCIARAEEILKRYANILIDSRCAIFNGRFHRDILFSLKVTGKYQDASREISLCLIAVANVAFIFGRNNLIF